MEYDSGKNMMSNFKFTSKPTSTHILGLCPHEVLKPIIFINNGVLEMHIYHMMIQKFCMCLES